jgi:hypothetical protein
MTIHFLTALFAGLSALFWLAASVQRVRPRRTLRYRRLLERVTEESDRQTIFNLLAEEQQKQKDAGDPI